MSNPRSKYYDNRTLYVTSGVAREEQLHKSLRMAIKNGEENFHNENLLKFLSDNDILLEVDKKLSKSEQNKVIKLELNSREISEYPKKESFECKIRVNLIVNKSGNYYGFGYIHVSKESVYWMLLGKNPDGSERTLEYLDPTWVAPPPKVELTEKEEMERYSGMKWFEIAEEEDKYVQPVIKEVLSPLMEIPGYVYDEMQYAHHQEIAIRDGKNPDVVPRTGFFELSRAYARDVESGKISNILCARQVPDWIPHIAFKHIFRDYANDSVTKHSIPRKSNPGSKPLTEPREDSYPMISLIDGKKDGGKVVFITFDPNTKDAIFALLMTRKVHIVHPSNNNLECTLIFDHAYEQGNDRSGGSNRSDRSNRSSSSNRSDRSNRSRSYQPVTSTGRRNSNDTRGTQRNNARTKNRNWGGSSRDTDVNRKTESNDRDNIKLSKYNYTKKF